MMRRLLFCVSISAFFWQVTGIHAELPPLIPREVLLGNPDRASPRISPDGKRLAYLAPDEGVLNVWIRTLGETDDRAVTRDRSRGIRWYFWAQNNKHILFSRDLEGDENWHLHSVDLDTNEVRDLTPFDGVQARVIAVDRDFPNRIRVGINRRNPRLHDVFRLDLTKRRTRTVLSGGSPITTCAFGRA